ncbi:MAG: methyltransferase domain-containing protein [bacterium]|nr:methyltransferase domain-containing protein [bacterium]
MALSCPIDLDVVRLRKEVGAEYTRVAEDPHGDFHFHRGFDLAVNLLRYDPEELRQLPVEAVDRFAGVGNPLRLGPVHSGETVLDIGSGAGTDLLLAARRVGPSGRVIGVDMTPAMREMARANAVRAGVEAIVEIRDGISEDLPVEDASVDVVISNGVLNLATNKLKAFSEVARVLKPGCRLMLADVVLTRDLSEGARNDIDLWAA